MSISHQEDPYKSFKDPNIVVMGAGAVGGFYGAHLARRYKTWFIARGEHLKAMKKNGMSVHSKRGDFTVNPRCTDQPSEISETPQLILFTVKSYDTDAAIEQIKPIVGEETIICTLQNGIENAGKLNEAFGADHVVPGLCQIGAMITRPGVLEHTALGNVTIGTSAKNNNTEHVSKVHAWLNGVGVSVKSTDDIELAIWKKFAWNAIFNMITGITSTTTDTLYTTDESLALCRSLFTEIKQAASGEGVTLEDDVLEQMLSKSEELGAFKTSTYQDRVKGKPMEYDAFTGALLRLADKHNLEFPHFETFHALFEVIEAGR